MFRKTIDMCCEDRAKGINTVCTQCSFFMLDQVVLFTAVPVALCRTPVRYVNLGVLRVYFMSSVEIPSIQGQF
jgi:hypothetical protein